MKKSSLFLACCIGLMLLASCKKDPVAPTIGIYEGEGCVIENAQVYSGDPVMVGFTCTGEDLTRVEIVLSQNGTVLSNYSDDLSGQKNDPVPPYVCKHGFVIEATGAVTIKGTVTDANGLTASKSFVINYEEKPCAKFVGRYEGIALVTGTLHANINGMDPIDQDFTDRETPIMLELEAGESPNEVSGTCTFEDRTIDCKGTVEGDMVTFEAMNDVITFNYDMGGFSVSPQLNVTYNIKGTLTDSQLMLDGTCSGGGNINLFIYSGTVDMDATVGGSLTKE